jgi:hypothetical protein
MIPILNLLASIHNHANPVKIFFVYYSCARYFILVCFVVPDRAVVPRKLWNRKRGNKLKHQLCARDLELDG